jgi:secreted trypsin-like serine protease
VVEKKLLLQSTFSGGGIVLKTGKKWFIRGIVSASLRDGASCDVNSYAIFTDIAKFMPWIRTEMTT